MLRRPPAPGSPAAPLAPLNSAEMSIRSPALMRASLSNVSDILSFSIFDSVEGGSPVRTLTSASVQPCLRRKALSAAPGLATDLAGKACSDIVPPDLIFDFRSTPVILPALVVVEKQIANFE